MVNKKQPNLSLDELYKLREAYRHFQSMNPLVRVINELIDIREAERKELHDAISGYVSCRKSVIRELIADARSRRFGKLIITADEMETILDDLESVTRTLAVNHEAACSLVDEKDELVRKLEAAEKRIAELEELLSSIGERRMI